jgi:tyrosyl-tRNA synthetase
MSPDFIADLEARGLLQQTTSPEAAQLLRSESVTTYIGFDPTADSLHVGSLLPVLALMRLQRAGHKPIAVVGGGTGMIGDPSGKSAERSMLSRDQIHANVAGIRAQLDRFLDFTGPCAARVENNLDWLGELNVIAFLRDIGKHFSVNSMIQRDSVQLRLTGRDQGISFTEFTYALLQAYDFLELYDRYGCRLQMGGSDQWGNIVDGCELIRRLRQGSAYGITMPLITKADGTKFGKTEGGSIWLDAQITSPYAFHQFFLASEDSMVGTYLRVFSPRSREEIEDLERQTSEAPHLRAAQRALADDVTDLVHGEPERRAAVAAADALFGRGSLQDLPAGTLSAVARELNASAVPSLDGLSVASALQTAGVVPSLSAGRRAIAEGGAYVNNAKVSDADAALSSADLLPGGFVVVRRGKRTVGALSVQS